jgi:2-polyprenyl-3-methyl-5-hydroxy-6-metoxy-1,4-benzoquinol methylase
MINKKNCKICGFKNNICIDINDFFLRIDSSNKNLIDYKNFVCANCGNIFHYPEISSKKLIKHYQSTYRNTDSIINLKNTHIDLPVKFEWTTNSFHRFYGFYEMIRDNKIIKSKKKISILDYGCYQGAFLYACKKIFNFKTIGTDFNKEGLNLAKSIFNVDEVFETKKNFFQKNLNVDIISLLHVLEHLSDPVDFLIKIKKKILKTNGLIYIEIPNPFTNPLNDPTHLNLYSIDTIKYLLYSCNYKILSIQQRGLYKTGKSLRDNNNLNLHILAQSENCKEKKFKKIMIGKKVYSKLLRERRFIGLIIVRRQLKNSLYLMFKTIYSFHLLCVNYFFPNYAVKIHNFFKKIKK